MLQYELKGNDGKTGSNLTAADNDNDDDYLNTKVMSIKGTIVKLTFSYQIIYNIFRKVNKE